MIQMVKGTYGRMANGRVEPMTKHSCPFSLSEAREAELVKAGVAAEKAKAAKSKKELIGLLEAAAKTAPGSGKE